MTAAARVGPGRPSLLMSVGLGLPELEAAMVPEAANMSPAGINATHGILGFLLLENIYDTTVMLFCCAGASKRQPQSASKCT